MAVYKRGYQRYQGPLTGYWTRLLSMPRHAWRRLFQQRLVVIVLVLSLFWPLSCAAFIYFSNHSELWQGLGGDLMRFLEINGRFFAVFMNLQAVFAVILATFAGPGLIAPDLAHNALPLYFSRPFTRWEYVLARLLVLVGLLSVVTWVPGLLLFFMQTGMAGWDWFAANWQLGAALLAGFAIWILLVSLVALACSAYVRWRIIAGALVLGFFFVVGGAAEMLNAVMRVEWGAAFNPARAMYRIWCSMLGVEVSSGPGVVECAVAMTVLAALLCWVLDRKLRPVEVVS